MNFLAKNMHPAERTARAVLGIALLALVFIGPHSPWGWIGLIPLGTSLFGNCPLYSALHISTLGKAR